MTMTLVDFADKIWKNKYSKDYVQEIDGRKYMFSFYTNSISDVTDYENEKTQIIHSCLERYINKKVDVINFVRDCREDFGDDGGYCFYVGIYEGQYVLGTNYISYNLDFSDDFVNVNKLEEIDEGEEYMFFDTLEDVDAFIKRMIEKTEELAKEDEDWGYESWYLEEDQFESRFMFMCIRNLGSAFCEYAEQNTKNLLSLTNGDNYTQRLFDPVEYYDGWLEREKIQPMIKLG